MPIDVALAEEGNVPIHNEFFFLIVTQKFPHIFRDYLVFPIAVMSDFSIQQYANMFITDISHSNRFPTKGGRFTDNN